VIDGAAADGGTPARVLICDDNEAIRKLLSTVVDNEPGLQVVGEAADGNEAIVEAIGLKPDVILLDLAMPKRNGLEALPELRRVAPDARIVVLSGFTSANVAEEVLALGAARYVEKGADPDAIVAAIAQALAPPSLAKPAT
jgi:two-component system, chemotaxis family, chemotaxis protein CheY